MSIMNKNAWEFVRVGRTPLFKQPEELEEQINQYFQRCIDEDIRPLKTGLAGIFGSWDNLYAYKKREGFKQLIEYSFLLIEGIYEEKLLSTHTKGAIFALKNTGHWVDKTEQTQKLEVTAMPTVSLEGNEPLKLDIGDPVKRLEYDEDD